MGTNISDKVEIEPPGKLDLEPNSNLDNMLNKLVVRTEENNSPSFNGIENEKTSSLGYYLNDYIIR